MDKLLISTMLKLVYWDGQHDHIVMGGDLGKGTAHYHGISWDTDGRVYVTGALDFSYVVFTLQMPDLRSTGAISGELHEPHEVFFQNGRLYVTNTGKNRVEIWNGAWTYHAFHPSPCDLEHINAIWSDGHQFYVAEHGQKVARGSVVHVCNADLDEMELIHIGPNIHNVYVEDGMIYNLTSGKEDNPAAILMTNWSEQHWRREIFDSKPILLRGLARTKDHWYVGISRWDMDRSARHVGDAIILQLDNDFNEVDRIVLPDYGPVCEVRVLGNLDLAHNGLIGYVDVQG